MSFVSCGFELKDKREAIPLSVMTVLVETQYLLSSVESDYVFSCWEAGFRLTHWQSSMPLDENLKELLEQDRLGYRHLRAFFWVKRHMCYRGESHNHNDWVSHPDDFFEYVEDTIRRFYAERGVKMINELKTIKDIWLSGGRPSDRQLEALAAALREKQSREPLEDLESDVWVSLKVASLFKDKDLWEPVKSALSSESYYNKKKDKYFLYFQAGDHHFEGDFFYWLTFKHEITRREFQKIMAEAEKPDDRYASLSDPGFQAQYGILSFEEVRPDYLGGLEPMEILIDKDGNIIPEEETELEPGDWDWGDEND